MFITKDVAYLCSSKAKRQRTVGQRRQLIKIAAEGPERPVKDPYLAQQEFP